MWSYLIFVTVLTLINLHGSVHTYMEWSGYCLCHIVKHLLLILHTKFQIWWKFVTTFKVVIKGAAVAQWLKWRSCTQQTWLQLALWVIGAVWMSHQCTVAGKTTGQNCYLAPGMSEPLNTEVGDVKLGRFFEAVVKAFGLLVWGHSACLNIFRSSFCL